MPTRASTRRTPEPIDASPSSLTRPSWPDLATWVPPHSSREYSPTSTIRTSAPYFSPNSASAPIERASSMRGVVRADRQVVDEDPVDLVLDLAEHRARHRAGGGEVEPEPAGRVLRARLRRRLAERAAQRAVHQVGRGVAARDRPAPLDVDLGVGGRPGGDLAVPDDAPVHDQPGQRRLHVDHLDLDVAARAGGLDHAVVGRADRRPRRRTGCGRAPPTPRCPGRRTAPARRPRAARRSSPRRRPRRSR